MKTLKLLAFLPIAAFAWGNYSVTDSTSVQPQPSTYSACTQSDERAYKQRKCANLIAEARLYQDRWIEFRHHRDPENGEMKNWERLNKLQQLIEQHCEH